MKKIIPAFLLSMTTIITLAQEPAQQSISISLEGGRSFSSTTLKRDALIGNGYQMGGDIFIPLFSNGRNRPATGNSRFTLGIIAGGQYQSAENIKPDITSLQSKYKLPTGNLEITDMQNGASNSHGFVAFAGVRADLRFGKITISPAISGGYFSLKRDGFTQNSQIMVNGTHQPVVLSASQKQNITGFITIPKLKVSYSLTDNLSIYAAGAINAGPTITTTQSYLVPAGGFNEKNTYEAQQLASGKLSLDGGSKDAGHFMASSVHIGISWSFGSSSAKRLRGKVVKTGDGGMMPPRNALTAVTPSLSNGAGGAAAASYAATGRMAKPGDSPVDTTDKRIGNTSDERTGNSTDERIGSTPGKQTQGAAFGEKVSQGLHAAGSAVQQGAAIVAGSPIGGITVKGGKNPGGSMMTATTNSKGEFEFAATEDGNYLFTVTAPEQTSSSQGDSTTRQNDTKKENPLYEAGGQSSSNPMNRTEAFVASPGSPIGGIVVKGGKNPGGSTLTITTNNDGTFQLNGIKAGNYRFVITAPAQPPAKSISEKGIK